MSDPRRWRDPSADAPSHVRDLLQQARPTRAMSSAERARAVMDIARVAAVKPAALVATGLWVKATVLAVGLGTVGTAVAVHRASLHPSASVSSHASVPRSVAVEARPRPTPAAVPTVAVDPPRVAEIVTHTEAPASGLHPSAGTASHRIAHPTPAPAPSSASIGTLDTAPSVAVHDAPSGRDLVGASAPAASIPSDPDPAAAAIVRLQSMVRTDPAGVLRELAVFDTTYPHSQWGEDRARLSVLALLRLGREDQARAQAAVLEASSPRSRNTELVRRALERVNAP